MSTPATPEVTPGPDDQTAFVLWPDHDPNLHRSGIYEFEIDADELKQVLQAVVLPKRRAPFLTIKVSTSILTCRAQTNDASFVIAASAPLLQAAEIGFPIRFEVDRNVMMNTIPHFNGPLAFTFDRFSSSLGWVAHEGDTDYRIDARWLAPAAPEAGLRPLAVVSREVGRGIKYAATLIGRIEPPNFPYDGVVVEGASILGGYYCGASRYRSPLLPENLIFSVPKDHVANALALCHRLAGGPVEVLETDARIYLKADNIAGSWNRINHSPRLIYN